MSSKSRKHSSSPNRKDQTEARQPDEISFPDPETGEDGSFVDDLVIVPKERSKLFFILMIALLIFLLIIFIVPSALMSLSSGGSGPTTTENYLSYSVPVDGVDVVENVSQGAFLKRRESIDKVLELDPFLLLPLGLFGGRGNRMEEEDHARLVYLDRLAEASGIFVPMDDAAAHLMAVVRPIFAKPQDYAAHFQGGRGRVSQQDFENELQRMIRVRRFVTMIGDIPQIADPAWIEERWKEDHIEDRFEYATLEVASLEEELRAAGVEDEVLSTWYDALEDFQKESYRTDERRVVSFADVIDVAAFDATALLAKYPTPEGSDPETLAGDYYNSVFFDRFIYDATADTAGPDAPDDVEAPEDFQTKQYLDLEEVMEAATLEAPIFFALEAWSVDLQDRLLLEEEVDFAAEAAALGIPVTTTEALTGAELREIEGRGTVAAAALRTSAGNVGIKVEVSQTAFTLLHIDELVESIIPELAAVRDEAFDEWLTIQTQEQALERLEAIRSGLVELELDEDAEEAASSTEDGDVVRREADSAAFRAACEAAGMTVSVREWIDRRGNISDDSDATEPAHIFLRSHPEARESQVDEVIAADLNNTLDTVYLVRKDGQREVPLDRMGPQEYSSYKNQSESASGTEIRTGLSFEFLQESVGLTIFDSRTDEQRTKDEEREAARQAAQE
ncbi:MAG: hypothetical protein ACI8QS_003522 [Planctomycetota bacterium]|jgi:hypothetical protein